MNKHDTNSASIGKAIAHDSAHLHVSGKAAYLDDIVEPQGCLHAAPICASVARGKVSSLEWSEVKASDGVVCVIGPSNIPGTNDCSPAFGGDPIFAEHEINFHGQVVGAVIATSHLAARKAARKIKLTYDTLEPDIDVDDGLNSGGIVLDPYRFERGEVSEAFDSATAIHEGSIMIGGQEHFYLEGQISHAVPGEDGMLKVHCSTQHPSEVQHLVARCLGVPDADVVCECRRMGGGFGGKESQAGQWACIAALGARHTGKAVKMRLDRDDDMMLTGKRHDFKANYQIAHDENGMLEGVKVTFSSRCGHSADLSLGVNDRTMFHADNSYYYPAVQIDSNRVRTHTVSNTAFRGFGGPQGMVFCERMMDELSIKLGIDPLEIRKRNFYATGKDVTPYGMKIEDNILKELVSQLESDCGYQARRKAVEAFNKESKFLKKGIALNPVKFGIAFTLKHLNQAGALVHVYSDGSIQINHGGTEMGQGLYLKVAQVVAQTFGVEVDRVRITATVTDKVPNTTPTAASSGSDLNGMAALKAASKIKSNMANHAAQIWGVEPETIEFHEGQIYSGANHMAFGELAKSCFLSRIQLSATGFYSTPNITWDRESVSGQPFLYFAYGASCSEVLIDTLTGELKIERVDILHDVGDSLNPAIDIGQIEGGFVQGMGWLTSEELVYDEQGRLATHAPSTYKIPTAMDVPEQFFTHLYQGPDGKGNPNRKETIYRSKAVGEPPVMLANSVFSAIYFAIASLVEGKLPKLNAPATPEAILMACQGMIGAEE